MGMKVEAAAQEGRPEQLGWEDTAVLPHVDVDVDVFRHLYVVHHLCSRPHPNSHRRLHIHLHPHDRVLSPTNSDELMPVTHRRLRTSLHGDEPRSGWTFYGG